MIIKKDDRNFKIMAKLLYDGISQRVGNKMDEERRSRHRGFRSPVKLITKLLSQERPAKQSEISVSSPYPSKNDNTDKLSPLCEGGLKGMKSYGVLKPGMPMIQNDTLRAFSPKPMLQTIYQF